MNLWWVSVLATLLVGLQILRPNPVSACSSVCNCLTVPAKTEDADSKNPAAKDEDEDSDIDMAQPRGRKVTCYSKAYPISSLEDISTVTTIPLDTIKL